jgi:hypothetical protein
MTTPSADPPPLLLEQLDSGETLLWWDRPPTGFMMRKDDWWIILVGMVWTVSVFYFEKQDVSSSIGISFALAVAFGLYLLVGRFFHDSWLRSRTIYGLTSRRAIILVANRMTSLDLADLEEVALRTGKNGVGTLTLGPKIMAEGSPASDLIGRPRTPSFERIADAKRVRSALREAREKLGGTETA